MFPIAAIFKSISAMSNLKRGVTALAKFKVENGAGSVPSIVEQKFLADITKKSVFQSKKFIALVAGIIIPILNHKFDLGLNNDTVVYLIMTYMGAQAVHDHGRS